MPPNTQPSFLELQDFSSMDRLRNMFTARPQYEPIEDRPVEDGEGEEEEEEEEEDIGVERYFDEQDSEESPDGPVSGPADPFSKVYYSIFLLMGIAMLWAW